MRNGFHSLKPSVHSPLSAKDAARFLQYIQIGGGPQGDCWPWLSDIATNGYGRFFWNGKARKAHRISFLHFNGPIKDSLLVCHTCDNRRCVNPAHLFEGTHQDNMRDCEAKGRVSNQRLRATDVNGVLNLFSSGMSQKGAARHLGVSPKTISNLFQRCGLSNPRGKAVSS